MHKGIIIYLSILVGLALMVGGSYHIIDNIIKPQGLMFEGIIAAALGITLLMVVIVAATVGKVIILFSEILEQTTKLNQEIINTRNQSPMSFANIFKGMIPPGADMTITNLNTGETSSTTPGEQIGKMNEIIANALSSRHDGKTNKNKDFNNMSVKELEAALAKSIKEDNFESAAEINVILKEKRNPDSDSEEKNSEEK